MSWRTYFPNGIFGDPALFLWEPNQRDSLLFDCGSLAQFAPRQLLKISTIFVSHCHMDHFFGFDLFLRVHAAEQKRTVLYGPPEFASRVWGKLQGYTWNLVREQELEFLAIELDSSLNEKRSFLFKAKDGFNRSSPTTEYWDENLPICVLNHSKISAVTLDHRTPSLAYALEQLPQIRIDPDGIKARGLRSGPWLQTLKDLVLADSPLESELEIPLRNGGGRRCSLAELQGNVWRKEKPLKISYATDGAAHEGNSKKLKKLVTDSQVFFAETCFLNEDASLANDTKHFTAKFMGELAEEASVKFLAPFHFSKRYADKAEEVRNEIARYYSGTIIDLSKSDSPHF